jgi:Bacterial protein of unknown function (DUF885)
MNPRIRALTELFVPIAREYVGLHEWYDGVPGDLSRDGVSAVLARLGDGPAQEDAHDEAHLVAFEAAARVAFAELEVHRSNPFVHLEALDLACYDREYAPAAERAAARRRHLAAWPEAIDTAVTTLDRVPAPTAAALLETARGFAGGLTQGRDEVEDAALAALARLVAHLERLAADGDPDSALGADGLSRLLGSAEAMVVDLSDLARRADAERDRLRAMLTDACDRIAPGTPPEQTVATLVADHPDAAGVLDEAREITAEVIAWTQDHDLVPYHDGDCLIGLAPQSRQWAMAMMSGAAPYEPPGPSWYHVTPPRPEWSEAERQHWLQVFSRTTLPAITVHEVAPGHFSHGLALRRAGSDVRRVLQSEAFIEGWAHYAEEMALEEGFRAGDPRYAIGVAIEALIRVTRLVCSIGVHTGAMTVPEAAHRFEQDAFLAGPAALAEARRATFDPTYGRYTWGKLEILRLREEARHTWGAGFSLPRFHRALLGLGSPPLGLIGTAITRG